LVWSAEAELYGATRPGKALDACNWYVQLDHFTKPLDRPFLDLHPRSGNHLSLATARCAVNATPGAPVLGLACRPLVFDNQHLEYGDSFEPNSNEQSYRRTDGRLAHRLRRWRHGPDNDSDYIARHDSSMLWRLVVYRRLQWRRDGELQRRQLHGRVLDARQQSIDE
jgi:hypothetical protein